MLLRDLPLRSSSPLLSPFSLCRPPAFDDLYPQRKCYLATSFVSLDECIDEAIDDIRRVNSQIPGNLVKPISLRFRRASNNPSRLAVSVRHLMSVILGLAAQHPLPMRSPQKRSPRGSHHL